MAPRKPKIYAVPAVVYVTALSKDQARRNVAEILDMPGRIIKATVTKAQEAK